MSDNRGRNRRSRYRRGGPSRGSSRPHYRDTHHYDQPTAGPSAAATVNNTQPSYWSYDTINELSRSSSQKIIERIRNEQTACMNAFKFDGNLRDNRLLKLINILYGLSNTSDPNDIAFASRIISAIFTDCFKFMSKLNEYIQMSTVTTHINPLINIGRFCIDNVPQSTIFSFPQAQLREAISALPNEESLKSVFNEYDAKFNECRSVILRELKSVQEQQQKGQDDSEQVNPHDLPPPNSFRDIEILPQSDEIKDVHDKPFLRSNLIKGSYHDWDHYLDVHFRLLREDFMGPLRDSIHSYLQGIQHGPNIQLYSDVHVLMPVCIYTGIAFLIQFDVSRFTRVRWEHSRRLIYGSLVCLSKDNFRTVDFASVVNRDTTSLQQGQIIVKFEGDFNAFKVDPLTKYEMVESSAYFEAYRHVLYGLQNIRPDQMPFRPYIVGGHDSASGAPIPLPAYLRSDPCLDLNSILKPKKAIPRIDVTKHDRLSNSNSCFDDSQLNALQMALSQEISVIQGPPGTGKTYIGLKIVEALLQNRSKWDPRHNCPILVVCYTNHALDQFLEGILNFSEDHKKDEAVKVVRLGGRCKNENIKKCAMANLVSQMKRDHAIPGRLYRNIRETRADMRRQKETIERALKAIDAKEGQILPIEELKCVMKEEHYQQLVSAVHEHVPIEKILEYWLDLWFTPSFPSQEDDDDEEKQIAAAVKRSLQMDREESPPFEGGLVIEGEEGELIDVPDEPQLLAEDRIIEGEGLEFPVTDNEPQVKNKQPKLTVSDDGWQVKQLSDSKRKERIKNGMRHSPFNTTRANSIVDVWEATELKKRWRLYKYWLHSYIRASKGQLKYTADSYDICARQCRAMDEEVNSLVLRFANVVGVTTTGAAKHSYIFKHINPKIVIVEEAAEVLESHIVTSLCSSVQQLILIGDHKQLQPKITHYELERKHNMHISLFERLAMNNLPISTLVVQHRMRPEIASIVGNHIYERLENHESVLSYETIRGVGKNLYFIDHTSPEKANPTGDVRSHANLFEARYVVTLTRYFLKQGYERSQITILTMYRGQLFEIRQHMRKDEFDGVRVAAVDDFQGEENDIIILSLVRSNSEGRIGFLKVENRVCVSLSRAKKGMFVVGNFSMLRDKMDTKWPGILGQLDSEGYVGDGLPLYCQNHRDDKLVAKSPEDFSKRPEGGCQKACNYRLECGHVCCSPCHPVDREHKLIYKCQQKCSKKLSCGHTCQRKCYECQDGCGQCRVNVSRILPKCGHVVRMQCSQDVDTFICKMKCLLPLSCGHYCQNKCQEPCSSASKCIEGVFKSLSCGHTVSIPCNMSVDRVNEFKCPVDCSKTLDCGHSCNGSCGECYQGRLHVACSVKCDRPLSCNHLCSFPCTPVCPPCTQKCDNYCYHSHCPKLCYEPCPPCREPCQWKCSHYECTAECGQPCNRPKCNAPCRLVLKCGHYCSGLCGEDCPPCVICNKDIREIFFGTEDEDDARFVQLKDCGHTFEVTGLDQWMDAKSKEEAQMIKFIECPKCKTPIRRSLRYGNIIKGTIADLESVKLKLIQESHVDIFALQSLAEEVTSRTNDWPKLNTLSDGICKGIKRAIVTARRGLPPLFLHQVNTVENILNIIPRLVQVLKCFRSLPDNCYFEESLQVNKDKLKYEIEGLIKFLSVFNGLYLTEPQISSAMCEVRRLWCLCQLCSIQVAIGRDRKVLRHNDHMELMAHTRLLVQCDQSHVITVTSETQQEIDSFVRRLQNEYSIGGISKEELALVVKAMHDITKGAWYKCPNGHLYAIGECGGATHTSTCPECKATIGGVGHQLTAGNVHAGEVDGSRYSAWSEGANLANYDQGLLQRLFH